MSLVQWLRKEKERSCPLPPADSEATSSANNEVEKAVTACKRAKKRGAYVRYSDQQRAKIGRYAAEYGNKASADKFSRELGMNVSESSVRNMKKRYMQELLEQPDPDKIACLPHASRGRPLTLGQYDSDVASGVY